MRKSIFTRAGLLSWVVAGLFAGEVLAQAYPAKPVRMVNGFAPGGSIDVMLRIMQPKFPEGLGQPLVIDYRPGAAGIIGGSIAAKSPPDGYTLLMIVSTYTIHPSIYKNLPYDLTKDFVPVTLASQVADVLVIHPSVPARNVKDLIALAKVKPGRLNFGSSGIGGTPHLMSELFQTMAGIKMTHVPYKGVGQALAELTAGHVDLLFSSVPGAAPYIKAGRLRALGVAGAKRSASMPELPTIAEGGLPGYETTNAQGVLAPAGTPREIVTRIRDEFVRIMALPDVRPRLLELGMEPVGSTPEQFGEFIRAEITKWSKVVNATGIEKQSF